MNSFSDNVRLFHWTFTLGLHETAAIWPSDDPVVEGLLLFPLSAA